MAEQQQEKNKTENELILEFIQERMNNPIFVSGLKSYISKYKNFNLNTYEHKLEDNKNV